ncbi:DUF2523 family protein [Pseudomonas aeruginosa]|uniref:DUF2523 family protein n=1 Tax=Pseudomonas aeruginosa TaxID=287 RepID=UPI003D188BDF
MDQAKDYVFSNLGGVPAQWLQVLGLLQVDVCINILFSAYIARAGWTDPDSYSER